MCREPEIKVIVLSGGIGSGKSTVAAILSGMGMPVYEADVRARELYVGKDGLLDSIEEVLHTKLRDADGVFDKSLLAARLFGNGTAADMDAVEQLLFPALMEDFNSFLRDCPGCGYVVFESATILEKEFFDGFGDVRIIVDAPVGTRLARAVRRDNVTEKEILARMERQPLMNAVSDGNVPDSVDAVILNDSSEDELKRRVADTLGKLFPDFKQKV